MSRPDCGCWAFDIVCAKCREWERLRNAVLVETAFGHAYRDSGRRPEGEDSRSEAECEASQSGAAKTAHRPNTSTGPDQ